MHLTIVNILLLFLFIFLVQHCWCEQEILFDSVDPKFSSLITSSKKWQYDLKTKEYSILHGNPEDQIITPVRIRYDEFNVHVVYMNITYVTYTPQSQLRIDIFRFEEERKTGTVTMTRDYSILPSIPNSLTNIMRTNTILITNSTYAVKFFVGCKNFTGKVRQIQLLSHYCPARRYNEVNFPKTFSKPFSSITVQGFCGNLSTPLSSSGKPVPSLECGKDGQYEEGDKVFHFCVCSKGVGFANGTCQGKNKK